MSSQVDHPAHYTMGRIEPIDAIEDWKLGFHEGNVVKYVARATHKGNQIQDLEKARWYLDRRIEQLKGSGAAQPTARTDVKLGSHSPIVVLEPTRPSKPEGAIYVDRLASVLGEES